MLHQVATSEPAPPRRLNPSIPKDLDTICLKCLHKDPLVRYATAQALSDDLSRFLAGRPIQARPIGRVERFLRSCRSHPAVTVLIATVIALLVVGTFAGAWGTIAYKQALQTSLLNEARAVRNSGRAGRYFDCLDAARRSTALNTFGRADRNTELAMRNEVVASMELLDLQRVREYTVLDGSTHGPHRKLSFAENARRFAFVSDDHRIQINDIFNNHPIRQIYCEGSHVDAVTLSPNGELIAVQFANSVLAIWRLDEDQPVFENATPCRQFEVAFDYNGQYFAFANKDGVISVVDTESWTPRFTKSFDMGSGSSGAKFSNNGEKIAVWIRNKIYCLDVENGETSWQRANRNRTHVRSLSWSPDDQSVLFGTDNFWAYRWYLGHESPTEFRGHQNWVYATQFDRENRFLLTSSSDGVTRLWSNSGELIMTFDGRAVVASTDGQHLFGFHEDKVVVWRIHEPDAYRPFLKDSCSYEVFDIAFRPDGSLVVTLSWNEISFWNPSTSELITYEQRPVELVAFSGNGKWLFGVAGAKVFRWPILDSKDALSIGERQSVTTKLPFMPISMFVSFDGSWIGFHDGQVSYVEPFNCKSYQGDVWDGTVAFDPSSNRIALKTERGFALAQLRDDVSQCEQFPCGDHINPIVFSPNGKLLVANDYSTSDSSPVIWNLEDKTRFRLPMLRALTQIGDASFSSDHSVLAVTNEKGQMFLIDVNEKEPIARLPTHVHDGWLAFQPKTDRIFCAAKNLQCNIWDLDSIRRILRGVDLDWEAAN